MEFLSIMVMAVVQGIAEFLPISSSGHLAVLGAFFGFDPEANLSLEIVLHAGTLAAIVVFYFRTTREGKEAVSRAKADYAAYAAVLERESGSVLLLPDSLASAYEAKLKEDGITKFGRYPKKLQEFY